MNNSEGLSTILDQSIDRAYHNLFSVLVTQPNTSTYITHTYGSHSVEKIDFGEGFSLDTEYNEATKQHIIKNAQRVKTISLTIWESSSYELFQFIKSWMDQIYDFKNNFFYKFDPRGSVVVTLDGGNSFQNDGSIICTGSYPISITYPTYDWTDGTPVKISVSFNLTDISFTPPKWSI